MNFFKPFQNQIRNRDLFSEALKSMYFLLDFCGESHWKQWIAEDIEAWEDRHSVQHHLSAYGGMGSLNDIVVCKANGHTIEQSEEPWLNHTFGDLKSVCYYLAKNIPAEFSANALLDSMGRSTFSVQGWRCLQCGYGEATKSDISYYVASRFVRDGILKMLPEKQIGIYVEDVCRKQIPYLESEVERVSDALTRSKIVLTSREGWMRPCPLCGSEDTAVYRWIETNDGFVPSSDNLEVKASL
jgi:hypothetical protein